MIHSKIESVCATLNCSFITNILSQYTQLWKSEDIRYVNYLFTIRRVSLQLLGVYAALVPWTLQHQSLCVITCADKHLVFSEWQQAGSTSKKQTYFQTEASDTSYGPNWIKPAVPIDRVSLKTQFTAGWDFRAKQSDDVSKKNSRERTWHAPNYMTAW